MFQAKVVARARGLILSGLMLALASAGVSAQDIKIGFNADQSGTGAAEQGVAARHGFELAIEDINKAGGVLGRKLVGVIRDDTGAPPKSIQNMTDLIDREKVAAVVGPTNSGNALAWLHLPQQKQIPVLVPVATATDITRRYADQPQNYIYRVSMADREQIALMMAYAVKATKNKKIGFLVDSTGFGQQGAKDLNEVIALHGLQAAAVEKFNPKDTDMTSQLAKLRDAGVDTLIIYALADGTAQTLRSMEKINYFPVALGNWGMGNTPFRNIAGDQLAEKLIFTASTAEDSNPRAAQLATRIRAKYGSLAAFSSAAQGYDVTMLLAAAMKKSASTDGPKVAAALQDIDGVEGVIKTYAKPFSKTNHEALTVSDFNLVIWKGGRVVKHNDSIVGSLTAADLKK